jgi:hypothetical protein
MRRSSQQLDSLTSFLAKLLTIKHPPNFSSMKPLIILPFESLGVPAGLTSGRLTLESLSFDLRSAPSLDIVLYIKGINALTSQQGEFIYHGTWFLTKMFFPLLLFTRMLVLASGMRYLYFLNISLALITGE